MGKERMRIVSQRLLAKHIYEMVLEGELTRSVDQPGRFVHIKVDESYDPLLRRPISICDADPQSGRLTVIYRAEGKGTKILAAKQPGEAVDVLGPLGHGFPVDAVSVGASALLVGGGIGVPPLYYLSKRLLAQGIRPIHVLGFASREDLFYKERFEELGDTYLATVDGSAGTRGYVTDAIEQAGLTFDILYACGPTGMLKALDMRYKAAKGFLSFEERMGCGIGACYACVCKVPGDPADYRKICSDGPVFAIGEVIL